MEIAALFPHNFGWKVLMKRKDAIFRVTFASANPQLQGINRPKVWLMIPRKKSFLWKQHKSYLWGFSFFLISNVFGGLILINLLSLSIYCRTFQYLGCLVSCQWVASSIYISDLVPHIYCYGPKLSFDPNYPGLINLVFVDPPIHWPQTCKFFSGKRNLLYSLAGWYCVW